MYRTIIISAIILSVKYNCSAQKNNCNLIGVYGECENIYNCFQIRLNEDKTFIYYINEYVPGKGIANGTWVARNDTLILDIEIPREKTTVKKSYSNDLEGKQLTFYIVARDTMPIDSGKIVINNQRNYWTDKNGQINLARENLSQVNVNYPFIQDSTFAIESDTSNIIDFYIPMGGTELIYQQPEKWLIEGKELIPIWFTDGKYQLRKDRAIKKVPKRKILNELK